MDGEIEALEIRLFLEGVFQRYGYDFRDYAPASLKRRVLAAAQAERAGTVSGLQEKVLHDPACFERLLLALTINVTSMFRDASFYRTFRSRVGPLLHERPHLRIWHAGCSTGEEVYSLAILLSEEGLYDRSRIYATDISAAAIAKAKRGVFPLASMQEYTANYLEAGGKGSFSDYYTARYGSVLLPSALRKNIVFAEHNLATDGSFNEFDVILCRNVMIYFNDDLRSRALKLFHESLVMSGVLGLGNKESLRFSPYEGSYEQLDAKDRLYRRIR